MWKSLLFLLITSTTFAQEPNFNFKEFTLTLDSVPAGFEVRKIQSLLSVEKDSKKLKILENAEKNYQWLDGLRAKKKVILVNIPSAILRVFHDKETELQMKVILGKKECMAYNISDDMEEWKEVETKFKKTIQKAKIEKIERIQNRKLWRVFKNELEDIKTKN